MAKKTNRQETLKVMHQGRKNGEFQLSAWYVLHGGRCRPSSLEGAVPTASHSASRWAGADVPVCRVVSPRGRPAGREAWGGWGPRGCLVPLSSPAGLLLHPSPLLLLQHSWISLHSRARDSSTMSHLNPISTPNSDFSLELACRCPVVCMWVMVWLWSFSGLSVFFLCYVEQRQEQEGSWVFPAQRGRQGCGSGWSGGTLRLGSCTSPLVHRFGVLSRALLPLHSVLAIPVMILFEVMEMGVRAMFPETSFSRVLRVPSLLASGRLSALSSLLQVCAKRGKLLESPSSAGAESAAPAQQTQPGQRPVLEHRNSHSI